MKTHTPKVTKSLIPLKHPFECKKNNNPFVSFNIKKNEENEKQFCVKIMAMIPKEVGQNFDIDVRGYEADQILKVKVRNIAIKLSKEIPSLNGKQNIYLIQIKYKNGELGEDKVRVFYEYKEKERVLQNDVKTTRGTVTTSSDGVGGGSHLA